MNATAARTFTAAEVRTGDVLASVGRVTERSSYAGRVTLVGERGTETLRDATTCVVVEPVDAFRDWRDFS